MLQDQESKLLESASTNINTSQNYGAMASNLTNLHLRGNKDQTQLSRLNNELRKFKMKLQDQEQESL